MAAKKMQACVDLQLSWHQSFSHTKCMFSHDTAYIISSGLEQISSVVQTLFLKIIIAKHELIYIRVTYP